MSKLNTYLVSSSQDLSRDLETGCPKFTIVTFLGILSFKGDNNYTEITTINMYLLIEIRHNIITQNHRNHIEMEKPQSCA